MSEEISAFFSPRSALLGQKAIGEQVLKVFMGISTEKIIEDVAHISKGS
jgi:hypothetical protein